MNICKKKELCVMQYLFRSYKIFRLFNIDVFLHGSIFLWLFVISLLNINTGIFLVQLFFYVLLHEFGHSLMAKHYNIPARAITLYPFGGIAELHLPDRYDATQEFFITLAGPLVNFVFCLLFFPILFMDYNKTVVLPDFLNVVLGCGLVCNLVLLLFNLIPCFPMDGGRIFRSIVYYFCQDLLKATKVVVYLGRVVGIGMIALGLYYYQLNLVFVSLIVLYLSNLEYKHVQNKYDRPFI